MTDRRSCPHTHTKVSDRDLELNEGLAESLDWPWYEGFPVRLTLVCTECGAEEEYQTTESAHYAAMEAAESAAYSD